uniref:Uncharacterized protein n=1 Tax=viral metagenome TaxID=1070528 RepID=A0A6C0D9J7_9ZZZZ
MDYCLLEDAFKETVATEKARKDEKRKMKRAKECFKALDPNFNPKAIDPDRPAYGKETITSTSKSIEEAFTDISANKVVISKPTGKLPSYFLGYEDDAIEGFSSDFSKEPEKGFEKASGKDLTLPSLDDSWKPLTPSNQKETTSYFDSLPTPGGTYPIWNKLDYQPREFNDKVEIQQQQQPTNNNNNSELQSKIDLLLKRLDDLEKESKRSPSENQSEIIAFVATGVFLVLSLSLLR